MYKTHSPKFILTINFFSASLSADGSTHWLNVPLTHASLRFNL